MAWPRPPGSSVIVMVHRKALSLVVVLSIAMGFAVFLWLSSGGDSDGSESRTATPQSFSPAQLDAFRVLRGRTIPLPPPLRAHFRTFRSREIRTLWLHTARYVETPRGGLWVVNGKGVTCIVEAIGRAISCVDTRVLFHTGVVLGTVQTSTQFDRPRSFSVWGIAPNWAKTAQLYVGGKTRMVIIRNNAYALQSHFPIVLDRLEH